MVSTFTWVLVGVVAYSILGMLLRTWGVLPEYVHLSGPVTTFHTKRGRRFVDWLATPKRAWRAWGNVGVGVGLVVMVGSFFYVVLAAVLAVRNPAPSAVTEPRNVLVIPGVNDFLPLSVAGEIVAGLVVALVVHEGGHALLCRVGDIEIESMGLALLTIVPLGAFVEPNEEGVSLSDRGKQIRMYVAGVTNNFAVSLLCLALLFGPVIAGFGVVQGVHVGGTLPGTPADQAGIESGSVITGIDGQSVANATEMQQRLDEAGGTVEVSLQNGTVTTVDRAVVVVGAVSGAPVKTNRTIVAVNGTAVNTTTAFNEAVQDRSVARLTLDSGETVETAIGGYTVVAEDGPLEAEGAPADAAFVVTAVDGQRTATAADLVSAIGEREPGETIRLAGYVDGQRETYEITLAEASRSDPGIGVDYVARGTSGLSVGDFGIETYPAERFLAMLGGDVPGQQPFESTPFLQRIGLALALPFASIVEGLSYNFPGFTGIAANFYTVSGPLSALGTDGAFVLANLLFWTGWLNLVVGQFNLVPTYPLDGGHILRVCSESIAARLPIERREGLVKAITYGVSLTMIGSFVFIIAVPQLLG
ncbi:site-2 protease family protein [Halomicrobium sp. IBSBa]|uniref:site-2 protease family protein n=1 Tax=Halomicrobium sp. IBSBa TaxID=2778916 RepID=UPI001ABFE7F8|nr:site-2 protease family protein [Halomicrobium sp. IBSBa]MBO4248684.1 site-2 protease family protein [Halomicrobium sp. IBSBa]